MDGSDRLEKPERNTPASICPNCRGERYVPSLFFWNEMEVCEVCYGTGTERPSEQRK